MHNKTDPSPLVTRALGATCLDADRCAFRVWAPEIDRVEVRLTAPTEQVVPLQKDARGYHHIVVEGVRPGARYVFRLDDALERPDPASASQPGGVHQPSEVVGTAFPWTDDRWFGLPLRDYIVYELHVGTFTPEGTFDAILPRLAGLKALGITALELMPVAQFPGGRNWGYDGVYPFAVQHSYGGPAGLRRLVNAAHEAGMAVVLDVVYNHLGPEGNYLGDFGPYFTERYKTPWGTALNFDGAHSDEVRDYFIQIALHWQTHYHIDALRLDAVHAIRDFSAVPFLEELAVACQRRAEDLNRRFFLIAESDMNMARHILPRSRGGYGLDAQWSDDFHHVLHVLLTGEQSGYYSDYHGVGMLARVFREGYAYSGDYSPYRKHRHGSSPHLADFGQFVVCAQNHDQIGNRMGGDRLSASLPGDSLKLAAGVLLLSPFVPMLFMGEDYGETAPFQYFTSHSDPDLVEAVRKGRAAEFASFQWQGDVPDPQDEATFNRCKLNEALAGGGAHRLLRDFHAALIALRRDIRAIARAEKGATEPVAFESDNVLAVRYGTGEDAAVAVFAFSKQPCVIDLPLPPGIWRKRLDSEDRRWGGILDPAPDRLESAGIVPLKLNGRSVLLFQREGSAAG
jgi:maltooligosyltrehalose trehalohydrolase